MCPSASRSGVNFTSAVNLTGPEGLKRAMLTRAYKHRPATVLSCLITQVSNLRELKHEVTSHIVVSLSIDTETHTNSVNKGKLLFAVSIYLSWSKQVLTVLTLVSVIWSSYLYKNNIQRYRKMVCVSGLTNYSHCTILPLEWVTFTHLY